jgi:hypothetical protein
MFTPQRERHGGLYGPVRPPSTLRLLAALVLVFLAIWYLSRYAG